MASKNLNLSQLTGEKTYCEIIFKQVWEKVEAHKSTHPQQKIFMMAFGDTSQPLPPTVVQGLVNAATRLGDRETYTGYEDVTGNPDLRQAICANYYQKKLGIDFEPEEVFVS
jgi:LL-diaminopimelate aminotransferase